MQVRKNYYITKLLNFVKDWKVQWWSAQISLASNALRRPQFNVCCSLCQLFWKKLKITTGTESSESHRKNCNIYQCYVMFQISKIFCKFSLTVGPICYNCHHQCFTFSFLHYSFVMFPLSNQQWKCGVQKCHTHNT